MYDFIIVGAGPAGASLASRLANSKKRPTVLLLEAGPTRDEQNRGLLSERFSSFMQYPNSNWGYKTIPQKHANDRVLDYSRGKGLGGSTTINICVYTAGNKEDFDRWAQIVNDDAFSWESAVKRRKGIESYDNDISDEFRKYASPDMKVHGSDGPLRIEFPKTYEGPTKLCLAAAEECGLGINPDTNSGNPIGLGMDPATSSKGRRSTAAQAFLSNVPDNLTIEVNAQVTKIILEGKKAVGVIANGKEYRASKDVVLSAGAVDSPKLLMLSGIGDNEELTKLEIKPQHHLPGVGNNLEDHYFTVALWRVPDGLAEWSKVLSNPDLMKKGVEDFEKDGSGPFGTFFHGLPVGFFRADEVLDTKEFASLPKDVQAHIRKDTVPIWEMIAGSPPLNPTVDPKSTYLSIAIFGHCPQSLGTVRLASNDPQDAPLIDPNFMAHPFDRTVLIAAAKRLLDYVETPTIKNVIIEPFLAPKSRSDEDLLAYWRETGIATWHPSCTVKMGPKDDSTACLDSDFRVRGLENLRVVDMSATPFLPNCHVQSIAYFIGATAAEKMVAEYGLDS